MRRCKDHCGGRAKPGAVYLIKQTGTDFYKIGMVYGGSKKKNARDYQIRPIEVALNQRLLGLQACNPIRLKLIYWFASLDVHSAESTMHDNYSAQNIRGEWFRLSAGDVAKFMAIGTAMTFRCNRYRCGPTYR